jgi:hypothetical protein
MYCSVGSVGGVLERGPPSPSPNLPIPSAGRGSTSSSPETTARTKRDSKQFDDNDIINYNNADLIQSIKQINENNSHK